MRTLVWMCESNVPKKTSASSFPRYVPPQGSSSDWLISMSSWKHASAA